MNTKKRILEAYDQKDWIILIILYLIFRYSSFNLLKFFFQILNKNTNKLH